MTDRNHNHHALSTGKPERNRFFTLGCIIEGSLIFVAVGLNALFKRPLFADLHWDTSDVLAGCLAVLPPLLVFLWILKAKWSPLARIRQFLNQAARPLLQRWNLSQLLIISILAGLGEEMLFRGALQGGLTSLIGLLPALLIASALFGGCHSMTTAYALVTTLIGIYLGALWILSANLITPIITHALYDFIALVWFLKWSSSHET